MPLVPLVKLIEALLDVDFTLVWFLLKSILALAISCNLLSQERIDSSSLPIIQTGRPLVEHNFFISIKLETLSLGDRLIINRSAICLHNPEVEFSLKAKINMKFSPIALLV